VPTRPRRLAYLGNPAIAVAPLLALHEASDRLGMEVVVVVTAEDRRRSRRGQPTPTPVGAAAADLRLPVVHDLDAAVASGADLGVVVAYGRIIPVSVLDSLPMLNLHFSLLPRWRGAAPVERALLAGDAETGVCLMDVAEELDTGLVRCRVATPIGPNESADELRKRLAGLGSTLLVDALAAGISEGKPQVGEPTWAHKIGREDLRMDWSRSSGELHRVVRVGGAHTTFQGEPFKVWQATPCGSPEAGAVAGELVGDVVAVGSGEGDGLRLVEVQPANRARMAFNAWAAGARPIIGEVLGT
ncbi:uncharacterized protein METZ01_LOCUS199291, partial [marine metagenome]